MPLHVHGLEENEDILIVTKRQNAGQDGISNARHDGLLRRVGPFNVAGGLRTVDKEEKGNA